MKVGVGRFGRRVCRVNDVVVDDDNVVVCGLRAAAATLFVVNAGVVA